MSTPTRRSLWWWRARAAGAVALVLVAFDLPFTASAIALLPSALILGVGLWAFVGVMLHPAPGEAAVPLRRKQITLSFVTSAVMLFGVLSASAMIQVGATRQVRRYVDGQVAIESSADEELGWAPYAPPGVVGQRLHRVDPDRRRILVIGDSVAYGAGLEDGETAVRLLEQQMPGWQVLNGSVSGWSLDQYYLYLRRVLPEVRPELVVIAPFTGNDYQITGREYMWGGSKPLLEVVDGRLAVANEGAPCIDRMNRSALTRALWHSRAIADHSIEAICMPRRLGPLALEETVSAIFDAIDATTRDAGVALLYVLLPGQSEYSGGDLTRLLHVSRHRALVRILARSGARELLDFAIDLAGRDDEEALYLDDHAHLSVAGQRVLAGSLRDAIRGRFAFAR